MDISIENAKCIGGWMSERELYWLAHQASAYKQILEVGSYKGRSTMALCDNTKGIVTSIDPYAGDYYDSFGKKIIFHSGDEIRNEFTKNLAYYLSTKRLIHYRTTLPNLQPRLSEFFGLIFIDGDHRFDPLVDDIRASMKLVRPGSIISGHDYGREDWPDVKRAVESEFDSAKINLCDTIWFVHV